MGLDGRSALKLRLVFVASFLSVGFLVATAQSVPIRPGIRQADQAETQTEKNIPPPNPSRQKIDLVKIGHEAQELAEIAQTIPMEVASVRNGMLPKDVLQKLKRIEKLSKRLRSELER